MGKCDIHGMRLSMCERTKQEWCPLCEADQKISSLRTENAALKDEVDTVRKCYRDTLNGNVILSEAVTRLRGVIAWILEYGKDRPFEQDPDHKVIMFHEKIRMMLKEALEGLTPGDTSPEIIKITEWARNNRWEFMFAGGEYWVDTEQGTWFHKDPVEAFRMAMKGGTSR